MPSSDDISATEWSAKMTREIDSILTFVRKYKVVDDEVRAARALRAGDVLREPLKQDRAKIPMRQNKLAQEMAAAEEKREKLVAERDAKVQRREEERVRLHEKRKDNTRVRQEAAESRRLLVELRAPSTPPKQMTPSKSSEEGSINSMRRSHTAGPSPGAAEKQDRLDNSLTMRQKFREQLLLDRAKAKESPSKFEVEVFCKEPGHRVRKSTPPPEPRPAFEPLPAIQRGNSRVVSPLEIHERPSMQLPLEPIHNYRERLLDIPPPPQGRKEQTSPTDPPPPTKPIDKRSALQAAMAKQRKARAEQDNLASGNDFSVEIVLPHNLRNLPQKKM